MDVFDRVREGKLYRCDDPAFVARQQKMMGILHDLNQTRPDQRELKRELYEKFFGRAGKNLYIELPFHANWGINTYWGDDCYANFNLTLVDDSEIYIGNNVLFGPNVTVVTAGHTIQPELRKKWYQFSVPVHIGDNVWIGAGSIIMPGVHIGKNSVIGAGSVVTKDVPPDSVAYGNPCRVARAIGERDDRYFWRDREIDYQDLE